MTLTATRPLRLVHSAPRVARRVEALPAQTAPNGSVFRGLFFASFLMLPFWAGVAFVISLVVR